MERGGGGDTLALSAGDVIASLPTRSVGEGRVQARTSLSDPILQAMGRSRVQIGMGGQTIPGGVAVRRVLDWCTKAPEPVPAPEASPTAAPPIIEAPPPPVDLTR